MFLRESRTRHSLLTKEKVFGDEGGRRTGTGVEAAGGEILIESDGDEEVEMQMQDIPHASDMDQDKGAGTKRQQVADDSPERQRVSKRRKDESLPQAAAAEEDKKMRFRTNYEGFNIYGWVLCLLVTRKGDRAGTKAPSESGRQVLMEEWISTQAQGDLPEE